MSDSGPSVVIVGAGVSGLVAALALAKAGHRSTIVDRDAAPPPVHAAAAADWVRRGVAQFQQPHAFLARLREELEAALPQVVPALIAAGAVDVPLPDGMSSLWCRRSTLEWTLRSLAEQEARITILPAAASGIRLSASVESAEPYVTGLRLADDTVLAADLVIDATGRRGRLTAGWSEPVADEPTNEVYTSRRYRLLPGAGFGPVNRGVIAVAESDAYTLLVFPHDAGTFSVTFTRLPSDHDLAELRTSRRSRPRWRRSRWRRCGPLQTGRNRSAT
jgi:2-polyprenyl-6-methoxyphenol hydroxylase-like FAD-dependent oxidoreductase